MDKKHIIMVVEDEHLLLDAITKKLTLTGIEVIPCASGAEAIAHLESHTQIPEAIWLDYYLKDMNGLDFLRMLKKNTHAADIPVLVVSNSASESNVHNMLALGASKYILKSEYRLDEIITMLLNLVTKKNEKNSHR